MVVGVLFGVLAICLLLTVPIAVSLGIATIAAGFSLNAVTGNQMLTMEVVDNASDENNENTRRKATVVPIKIEYV